MVEEVWENTIIRLSATQDNLGLTDWYRKVQQMRRRLVQHPKPASRDGQCRRRLTEARWHLSLSSAEVLLGTRLFKKRRTDCVWSGYLRPELQRFLLGQERRMTAIVETQIRDLKAMAEIQEVGKTLVYVIVPRKSAKWYIGKAATSRVWAAGRKCEGLVIRSLEHLAGAMKGGGRTQEGVKYKCWKAFCEDAVLILPILVDTDDRAGSFGEYGISRDQPGANVRGRKLLRRKPGT